ncbi:MAG: tRNA (adenine-N1)-methyltransferase [Bifidobacteriaceae bacterium]|jgi:tRNA (adenine57-N1/adenine58-N1)-methyltransferase|nr:tRNA (adenine-N1)-methyltransferase [Bifidobacteriaceae bacterium]
MVRNTVRNITKTAGLQKNKIPKEAVFKVGDRVQLKNKKGQPWTITLQKDQISHSHKGFLEHNKVIGQFYSSIVENSSGEKYLASLPTYSDTALSLKRGAAIIYPKDAAQICLEADLKKGSRVLECGLGSGALAAYILQILGDNGQLVSVEKDSKFAEIAKANVGEHKNWRVLLGELNEDLVDKKYNNYFDSVIFDMLDPWNNLDLAFRVLKPGGILVCYITTVTQLSRLTESCRAKDCWMEPESYEIIRRPWHIESLSVRPVHSMIAHTGFIFYTRRLADSFHPIPKRTKNYSDIDSVNDFVISDVDN